jgi:hypothetical protein
MELTAHKEFKVYLVPQAHKEYRVYREPMEQTDKVPIKQQLRMVLWVQKLNG